jgi:hypothetical protein
MRRGSNHGPLFYIMRIPRWRSPGNTFRFFRAGALLRGMQTFERNIRKGIPMNHIKVISASMFIFVLLLIPALAQQKSQSQSQQSKNKDNTSMQSGSPTQSNQSLENLQGIELFGNDNQDLGTIQDARVQNGQIYLFILGNDNKTHPVPLAAIIIIIGNIDRNDFNNSPTVSMDNAPGDSSWVGDTEDYYQNFELTRPVSQYIDPNYHQGGATQ